MASNYSFRDSAGYEVPVSEQSQNYTSLKSGIPEYRLYDVLNQNRNPATQGVSKRNISRCTCILVLVVAVLTTVVLVLSGIVVYLFLNISKSSLCRSSDCGGGECVVNLNGSFQCICPEDRFGEKCEHWLRLPFKVSQCPVGWIDEGSYGCLKVFNQRTEWRTWPEADEYCRSLGSDLVSIRNADEQGIIHRLQNNTEKLWIGLNRISGSFTWTDDSQSDYSYWKPNEPNNYLGNEDCVHIWEDGLWNDNNCQMSLGFVCKMAKTSECGLSGNWTLFNSKCYMLGTNQNTNMQAIANCSLQGSLLVEVYSNLEHNFLVRMASKYAPDNFWVGSYDSKFRSLENQRSGICVELSSMYGNWENVNCNKLNNYICTKSPIK